MLLSNALIGLREGLEAVLVVSILIAFLVRVGNRRALAQVWTGVGIAVLLSVAVGAVLTYTAASLSFEAQEAFGGIASIIAVVFVTGMVFWMRRAGRTLAAHLRGRLDQALRVGPVAVAVVAFLAVAREGLETAVFFFSSVRSAGGGTVLPLVGFVVGIAIAVLLGCLIYVGAVRLNLSRFFTITGVLLIIVAAGVLAYGVHDLQEAALLPGMHTLAFDVSAYVPASSWYGALAKGLFNFSPRTTVLEAIVWAGYVAVTLPLFLRPHRGAARAAGVRKAEAA
ncbi:high-affinity iron transporter [Saccharopolyspora erythraea NRRL 2338]|uniref:High-affinity iron transporter n=2 Tax=Saccharopolyspora erythraea TaxID=1836 RepID=A4FCD5_SACEN|nr:iron uptake transporter permease EfeU [Saccharopolyspora erythraea]EQD84975.1 iron transporter [Saccharopolyspora erythraea D]PFG95474.1 high-affinity iron transporter [Saccharopolyspora erythraea NRRL 2338]QRK92104.1 FTR1 family protein [Saccharopolyspora erythraea]CAM01710.1 high-affinity iron transporter [Saccharopolyspora erythraea NRRL 2338]